MDDDIDLSGLSPEQRLALARMPRLLILDEGTNAIDIASERQILTQLMDLTPRPTIIMIAHRSESLVFCDQVFTLRRGKLVEG